MLNFNEIEFQLRWEDGRAWIIDAYHLVEKRDLTAEENQWFEENCADDLAYLAREILL
jgi:hypothetical protein